MSRRTPVVLGRPKLWGYAALIAGGAGVLAACGHSAPTRFFTLDPVAPAAPPAAAYTGPPVKVVAVNIPPALDREELVSEEAGGEVRVHDFEHWEAPLGQTARQALIQDLAGRLPAGSVIGPSTPGGAGVATLSVDVISFQAGAGGARLTAGWSVTLPGSAHAPAARVWRAPLQQLQAPGTAGDGEGTAQAFSALLGQLADQIATTLPAEAARMQAEQAEAEREAAMPRITTRTTTRSTAVGRGPGV